MFSVDRRRLRPPLVRARAPTIQELTAKIQQKLQSTKHFIEITAFCLAVCRKKTIFAEELRMNDKK